MLPVRPAPSVMNSASSVDLSKDPYAVPPFPPNSTMPYRDDPAGNGSYYDPYRGPVPQTFASPPGSVDTHGTAGQPWATGGEAIPMNTYSQRGASPGPNIAYTDPYAGNLGGGARSTSPGPNLAYGGVVDPMRTGTPVQRMATPVGGVYGGEIPRNGTPGGGYYGAQGAAYDPYGRRSPGPNLAYGQ